MVEGGLTIVVRPHCTARKTWSPLCKCTEQRDLHVPVILTECTIVAGSKCKAACWDCVMQTMLWSTHG